MLDDVTQFKIQFKKAINDDLVSPPVYEAF